MRLLALNCGSSSVKFAVVNTASSERIVSGSYATDAGGTGAAIDAVVDQIAGDSGLVAGLRGVGHRVVHGGETFRESVRIDASVQAGIDSVSALAPLHNPVNLLGIRKLESAFPHLPQVAVFDTAFHQSLPPRAYLYALPQALYREHGVRRYGFHGTSHRYVAQEATRLFDLPAERARIVTAHLGNGCSTAAVLGGRSVETSMGFSPLEGLVMGTRSGDVDPGLHVFLAERLGLDLAGVTELLNRQSGLLGISGLSSDMRELETAEASGNHAAGLALEIFCYRLARQVASQLVPLGGLDALIFTGGIGENSARIRRQVLEFLRPLGFEIDPAANAAHGRETGGLVSHPAPPFAGVVATDEEFLIAADTARVLGA
ncbi:MAG TPA: acetate kinase [Myxococcales bacterium]|nr:acetate kinase [Myxococcales bacterium]